MKKVLIPVIAIISIAVSCGCAAILEGDITRMSPHIIQQPDRPPMEQIDVSNYNSLVAEILGLVAKHENSGRMYAYSYDGDVESDIERACQEVRNDDPICAYSVSDIKYVTTKIVLDYEIEVSIEYRRTKQQVESIINISTAQYWGKPLLSVMSEYGKEAVFRTKLEVTEESVIEHVKEAYYSNPGKIVMMPTVAVSIFPTSGEDSIIELSFVYIDQAGIMRDYASKLESQVSSNVSTVEGNSDAEVLISLANNLMACDYNEVIAKTISVHGAPNFAVTAYGALVNGSAVGEGYAMAFKALCDDFKFACVVVLGTLKGRIHEWNIVTLGEENYHVDVAMCDVNGIATAFLKTDMDFIRDGYKWERVKTRSCNGTMTYEDIVGTEEIIEDPDGEDGQAGGQPGGQTDSQPDGQSDGGTANTQEPSDNGNSQTSDQPDNGSGNTGEPPNEITDGE